MLNRKIVVGALGAVMLVGGWYAFRPERLFVNQQVSESLPTVTAEANASEAMGRERAPLATGRFHGVAHDTKGTASILALPDGKKVLRLTEFMTSNGPDVHVYLVAAGDATDNATVKNAGFLPLGPLKGNVGDQNYELPEGVDLDKYKAVTIWCQRFGVNFGTAPLSMGGVDPQAEMVGAAGLREVLSGAFHDGAHETKGTATIYQAADGREVLRLTNFMTSNGPDVHVYLVAAADAQDNATVTNAGFLQLGSLKGNVGDQNYEIPAGTDLSKYRAVTIWCQRFGVNFGTAPLAPVQG